MINYFKKKNNIDDKEAEEALGDIEKNNPESFARIFSNYQKEVEASKPKTEKPGILGTIGNEAWNLGRNVAGGIVEQAIRAP